MTISLISALWYLLTCPIQYGYVDGACHINSGVAPLSNDAQGNLTFTFPQMPQPGPWTRQQYHSANYLTTNFTTPLTGYSTLTITLGTSGTGDFYYHFDPYNTRPLPCARPRLHRAARRQRRRAEFPLVDGRSLQLRA